MNRVGAFFIHLGISLLVFLVLAYLIVYVWYPGFFFTSDGGWQGMRIVVGVDLVLGPALTFTVFKKGKPGLTMDLTLIGAFQAVCLLAGVYVVYTERPLSLIYVDGQFFSMSADGYTDYGVPVPDLSKFPGPSPKRLSVDLPDDPTDQGTIRKRALRSNKPLRTLAERYVPFSANRIDYQHDAFPLDALRDRDQDTGQIPLWLASNGGKLDDYAFFPFGARYEYTFLGIDRRDGRIKGLLEVPAPL